MLGDSSTLLGTSTDAATTAAAALDTGSDAGGAAASNSADDERGGRGGEDGERSFGGNRWPRQETLALLKIRSDMDVTFRDATVKGPLWDEVSRKLGELGYHRSAKKCKEKFENVYKYHKRTKEGRSGKPEGKTYRFFDQLEALDNQPSFHSILHSKPLPSPSTSLPISSAQITVPSTSPHHFSIPHNTLTIPSFPPPPQQQQQQLPQPQTTSQPLPPHQPPFQSAAQPPHKLPSSNFSSIAADLVSNSTSSSTSSDEELEGMRRSRKRKWKDFFERLMMDVIQKQEELQKRFLEAIEKREQDRMVREEAWRMQEMAKITREREILAQERSMAAAKDAAIMSFLQKFSEQQTLNPDSNPTPTTFNFPPLQPTPQPPPAPPPPKLNTTPPPALPQVVQKVVTEITGGTSKTDNGGNYMPTAASSSRWPKVEVQALISLRKNLETKYQDNGPKGPLWEEISAGMRKIGYNRNAKRCKEKWENINKYFKKVKESNKKRPEDSKTCPYFQQLDELYREKSKLDTLSSNQFNRPESSMVPLMVRPEQQWPPHQPGSTRPDSANDDMESEPIIDRHPDDEDDDDHDDYEDDKDGDDEDEEDESGGNYEIVASKPASVGAAE